MWVVFIVAGDEHFDVDCSFCDLVFAFPKQFTVERAHVWLEDNHLPRHAEEMTGPALSRIPTGGAMCNRCLRYGEEAIAPGHRLHRACFEVACFCPCSRQPAPLKESHVAE